MNTATSAAENPMGNVIARIGAHRERLLQLMGATRGPVRIASAYVTETGLLPSDVDRDVRLLTGLSALDIISGATSLDALESLIRSGAQCRLLSGAPRIHAKVYILDGGPAIVTSANFTRRALDSNIEVGVVLVDGTDVEDLIRWFDGLWDSAEPLDVARLSSLRRRTAGLCESFASLRAWCRAADWAGIITHAENESSPSRTDSLLAFFLCNTDRSHGRFSASSGYEREEIMKRTGFAAAWEHFDHGSHMRAVQPGDLILMYASGAGILGVGKAVGRCEILGPGNPDRISRIFSEEESGREWRIPVDWLRWVNEGEACPWKGVLPPTFQDVSGERWGNHRDNVVRHFFGEQGSVHGQGL
jgi:hypothetical protein